ncbi:DMT family transporter [Streptobacillus felis]|uniref:DMT family transporter n=1 Tax=Streptobacillus felis TaxID=1384509 RepID=UPI000832A575|nr:DMT family transporter [Streptobacillus felis]
MENKKRYYLGILFVLLSAIGFSSLQMIVKMLPNVSVASKLFYRNVIITIITYILMKLRGVSCKIEKSEWPLLTARVIFGILGVIISFYTLTYILLADSTTIQKLSSFIVLIFSYFFFNEKFTKIQFMALVFSFIGVILIVKPGSSSFSFGYILAILGAFCSASAYTCIRAIGLRKKVDPLLTVFYFSLASTIFSFPFVIVNGINFDLRTMLLLIGIGIFGSIGQFGITFAYNFAPAKEISVFEYSQVIISSILGFVFLSEVPDKFSIMGYIIIILVGIFMYKYNLNREIKNDK